MSNILLLKDVCKKKAELSLGFSRFLLLKADFYSAEFLLSGAATFPLASCSSVAVVFSVSTG